MDVEFDLFELMGAVDVDGKQYVPADALMDCILRLTKMQRRAEAAEAETASAKEALKLMVDAAAPFFFEEGENHEGRWCKYGGITVSDLEKITACREAAIRILKVSP